MFFHTISLFFFIHYLQTINSAEIVLNFEKQHEGEPLIFAALQENEENMAKPIIIPATYHGDNIEYRLPKKLQPFYRLSAACPAENKEDIDLNQTIIDKFETVYMTLFKNKNIDGTSKYCKNSLIPSVTITNPEIDCGSYGRNKGKLYHVGYWVNVNDSNANQDKKIIEFVTMYKICHDEDTVIFTSHILEPGQTSQHKISQEEFEKLKFFTALEKSKENKLLPKENDKTIHQFVPYDDMIPKTWKTSTLLDINTITVYEYMKPKLNKVDDFLRNYSTLNSISFKIYSGIVNDSNVTAYSDFFWFWKIIQHERNGVAIMIGLTEPLDQSKDSPDPKCVTPCPSDNDVCSLSNLEKLVNPDECMFCCNVIDIIQDLGVAVKTTDMINLDTIDILGLLKFNDQSDISLKYPSFNGLNV